MFEVVTEFFTNNGMTVLKVIGGGIVVFASIPVGMSISEFIDEKRKLKTLQKEKENSNIFKEYLDRRIRERDDKINQLNKDIEGLKKEQEKKNTRIKNLEKQNSEYIQEEITLNEEVKNLEEQVEELFTEEQVEEAINQRIQQFKDANAEWEQKYNDLEEEYNNLAEEYSALDENFQFLKNTLKEREQAKIRQKNYRERQKQKEKELLEDE